MVLQTYGHSLSDFFHSVTKASRRLHSYSSRTRAAPSTKEATVSTVGGNPSMASSACTERVHIAVDANVRRDIKAIQRECVFHAHLAVLEGQHVCPSDSMLLRLEKRLNVRCSAHHHAENRPALYEGNYNASRLQVHRPIAPAGEGVQVKQQDDKPLPCPHQGRRLYVPALRALQASVHSLHECICDFSQLTILLSPTRRRQKGQERASCMMSSAGPCLSRRSRTEHEELSSGASLEEEVRQALAHSEHARDQRLCQTAEPNVSTIIHKERVLPELF